MSSCTDLTADAPHFWIVAKAIKTFYDAHGVLPLPGSLPDMKSTSAEYIKLQSIYKAKARSDVAEVAQTVRQIEKSLSKATLVEESEVEAFCKNAAYVRVLTNPDGDALPSLRLAMDDTKTISRLPSLLENDWEALLPVFIAFNAKTNPSRALDVTALSPDPNTQENLIKALGEAERASGGELHNISSVVGGMVAQEAIKLLTRQYVPVDGTFVFDGIKSKSTVFKI